MLTPLYSDFLSCHILSVLASKREGSYEQILSDFDLKQLCTVPTSSGDIESLICPTENFMRRLEQGVDHEQTG